MPFDQKTRNLLQRTVTACRKLLDEEFAAQRRGTYGINDDGSAAPLATLTHLPDEDMQVAKLLRERLDHLVAGLVGQGKKDADARKEAVGRLTREQAFTVLNRLAALRMAEESGIVLECVRHGLQSEGFLLFQQSAGSAFGDTWMAYRAYLFVLFDEIAVDLGVLFSRWDPAGLLFPRQEALEAVLGEFGGTGSAAARDDLTPAAFNHIWAEDETIGWIYQYYNDPAERKKMREESAAPRNSRELAVRNQFFTPRYVVEFLTDNTLGRIWYEMTQGNTRLKDQCRYLVRRPNEIFLSAGEAAPSNSDNPQSAIPNPQSQEELLQQPVFIPHRPLKDPRTILMIDPACGSLHFGLYAFDLFEVIYEEAWELEGSLGANSLSRPPEMKSLHDTYASKDAFLQDVPRLIIEHNIHGIDIDPRCAQIAGLSLWLRAQKSWQRLGLTASRRPTVTRSNIVCAEPMPGEKELLREFVEREFPAAERGVFLRLLEGIFDKMQLAGEAGSLLKIEEEIKSAIDQARDDWDRIHRKSTELFSTEELNKVSKQPEFLIDSNLRSLTTDFWQTAESRLLAALRDYAEQAESGGGFQRRLFAEDAARGFAFIDLCRKRYDVILMNPPFGELSKNSKVYIEAAYRDSKGNILAHFLDRSAAWSASNGRVGAIVSRACFFLTTLSELRLSVLDKQIAVDAFADLGDGVLDAMVETAAATFQSSPSTAHAVFFRLLGSEEKDVDLQRGCEDCGRAHLSGDAFIIDPKAFIQLEGVPYVYWITPQIMERIASYPTLEQGCEIRVGLQTGNDERFLKLWHEVAPEAILNAPNLKVTGHLRQECLQLTNEGKSWVWYSKIDEASPFAASIHLVVNWSNEGREIKSAHVQNGDSISRYVRSEDSYFKPGISYMLRSSRLVPYLVPRGGIPTAGRSQIYPNEGRELWLLALAACNVASAVARFRGENFARPKFQNSMVAAVPYVEPLEDLEQAVSNKLEAVIQEQRTGFTHAEECIEFVTVPRQARVNATENFDRSSLLGRTLDLRIASAFGLSEPEMIILERDLMDSVKDAGWAKDPDAEPSPAIVPEQEAINFEQCSLSYSLGVAFGRWDVRFATGEQAAPELPDPFAPLPVCPPGQLQNAQGLPVGKAESGQLKAENYAIDIPWDGILVDDASHPLDIERRVREVIGIIWGGSQRSEIGGQKSEKDEVTPEAIEHEACEILGVKSLREYFRKPAGFFADHLKRYSKSRRQAPIYWPLSTASGSYTLWIYYHRLTPDTLYKCLQDFVEPKIKETENEIHRLRTMLAADEAGTKERKQLADAESLLTELRALHATLSHWAPRWKPNLNDGVVITASPLWELFRLPKWQKTLKETWQALDKGDYDWAHLALTLWPERVREKCKKDRSLAIAHSLEELCEIQAPVAKKRAAKKAAKKRGKMARNEEDEPELIKED
ncbi:MAG: BREX-1 system adenine-specific DNA-methyltransferase PglX [Verrucomicrobiota bacterium]